MGQASAAIGADIVDAHHHFYDTNEKHYSFLKSLGASPYLPEQYAEAVGEIPISRSVHIDAMPDSGIAEVEWIESLIAAGRAPTVAAIVAAVNLAEEDVDAQLAAIVAASSKVRGVRFMVDYEGPFDGGKNATHIAVSRHGNDYIRDTSGPAQAFERGFALLAKHSLSFDLQCSPLQLDAAAALISRHPDVPVVVDHLGKVRHLALDGSDAETNKLAVWRAGMTKLAALPNVYVKLSMLGYVVPGWHEDAKKEAFVRDLVREVIGLFGVNRCMFASNWHQNGAAANADGIDATGPTMPELYASFHEWVSEFSEADRRALFAGTAAKFYRI
ncbi:hypothetical protein H310_09274 [Aphanomyces invadans]|uniref:Amidohydrolase-related domain-containing protein n=1 Tax=Aphanomyces invadans TaxID=157072 RepID=A0A024TXB4_9STRA|nr:hypothetical protein H310_09274 [Aphanomyces invadans]ETV97967.1 hypothetical protein H310_09274 [Aphanomyces invadans]|eukprot:XP_008873528.1 hypothetical protein H310_09274 [Aphanomyces invadans]